MVSTSRVQQINQALLQYRPGTGSDRYVRFITELLNGRVGDVQRRLLTSLEENRRTVGVGANGVGKSYGVGGFGSIASLYCNPRCTVNITSGSYGQLDDTIWKPIKSIHRNSPLPGRTLDNKRELVSGLGEEWYLKCLSPRHPADLEGRHNERMIYIIEEADKPGITMDHIDSAESTMTDENDRMFVIANPPESDANVVSKLMDNKKWNDISFSSFETHNVQIDIGNKVGEKIGGLVELSEIRENWEDWNKSEWPGHEKAFTAHEHTNDLDVRWYRRRAGVIPPEAAERWTPLDRTHVYNAYERSTSLITRRKTPSSVGIDVARSGDRTVMTGVHGDELIVHYAEQGTNHVEQKERLSDLIEEWVNPTIVIDAVGEGSAIADELDARFPNVVRYSNGRVSRDPVTYFDNWAESFGHLGSYIRRARYTDMNLREELLVAAGAVTFGEIMVKSRGPNGEEVIDATPKDEITDRLGHSPDYLDSALMAVWGDSAGQYKDERFTW